MILLEKILLLKSVTLFKQVPDDLLKIIATSAKEKIVNTGDLILQKGEVGRDMFVIVNGRVRVHDDNLFIKELSEGDFFGELAALSFTRRVASVSALTDGLLLKISSATLYEIMDMDVGLAKGIIKALCERMEEMAIQLQISKKTPH